MRYDAKHVIHMLVSICARLEGRVGLIRSRSPETFDAELGRIAAHLLYVTSEGESCAWLASDVVHRYCSDGALRALSCELELLGSEPLFSFQAPEPRRVVGHPGAPLSGRVDLRGVLRMVPCWVGDDIGVRLWDRPLLPGSRSLAVTHHTRRGKPGPMSS